MPEQEPELVPELVPEQEPEQEPELVPEPGLQQVPRSAAQKNLLLPER